MIGSTFRILFKVLGYAFLAVIASVMLFAGFAWFVYNYVPWEDKKIERAFNKRLEEKMAAGEDKIYLKDLTDFEWDKVCYFWTQHDLGIGGISYPTPSEVLGREYDGYVPYESCDTLRHNDLFFIGISGGRFIRPKKCLRDNLCRTETFPGNLHCCSREAFLQKEFDRFSPDKIGYSLNEDRSEEKEQ